MARSLGVRPHFAALVFAIGCSGADGRDRPTSSTPTVTSSRLVTPSAPSLSSGGAISRGVQLTFDVEPSNEANAAEATFAVARRLTRAALDVAWSVRRDGTHVIVEVAGTDERTFSEAKEAMFDNGAFALARSREDDPLRTLSGKETAEFHVSAESVGAVPSTFAWKRDSTERGRPMGPGAADLLVWVHNSAPDVERVYAGRASNGSNQEPIIRTYLASAPPVTFEVVDARANETNGTVRVELDPSDTTRFVELSAAAKGKRILVLLGDEVLSAPVVVGSISQPVLYVSSVRSDPGALARRIRIASPGPSMLLAKEDFIRR
jgi:hypothetical protein